MGFKERGGGGGWGPPEPKSEKTDWKNERQRREKKLERNIIVSILRKIK